MSVVLYNAAGQTEPSPEIQRRLRAVDPHLSLRRNPSGGWWVTTDWHERDPRRAMIQRGEVSAEDAWDLLCEIPLDCGAEEVPGYIARLQRVNGSAEVRRLIDGLERYNKSVAENAMNEALAETMNRGELAAERGFGALPRVYNAGIPNAAPAASPTTARKRRGRPPKNRK